MFMWMWTRPNTQRYSFYWPIDGDIEEKKEVFGEGCREDDNRVTNAERGLHSRMTEDERVEALRWSAYYRALVRDGVDDQQMVVVHWNCILLQWFSLTNWRDHASMVVH